MSDGGNTVPRITKAEHVGPDDTGDNIEAKRVANYTWDGNSTWTRAQADLMLDQLAHLIATLEAGLPSYDAAGWRQRVILDTASNINTVTSLGSTSGSGAFLANNIAPDMSNISWGVLRNKITTS